MCVFMRSYKLSIISFNINMPLQYEKFIYSRHFYHTMLERQTQLKEPGFKSYCCHIKALAILFPHYHSSLSCKWVPRYRQGWKREWIIFAQQLQHGWMLPREVEMVLEWTGQPGGERLSKLNNPKDWTQCCVNINIPLLEVFLQVLRQPGTILVDQEWTISRVTSIGSLLPIPTLCVGTGWCHK